MGAEQAHGAGNALEFHGADVPELDRRAGRGVDHGLADDDLACLRVVGDPRCEIDRLAVVVTLLEDNRSGVQSDVRRRLVIDRSKIKRRKESSWRLARRISRSCGSAFRSST
jgi:hypothetical protein